MRELANEARLKDLKASYKVKQRKQDLEIEAERQRVRDGIKQEQDRVQLADSDTFALRLELMGVALSKAKLNSYTDKQLRVKGILR